MAERKYRVLTAVGPDRPGLVQEIASVIHGAKANLEDSRMAILGGEFALILLFSGSADAVAHVGKQVPALEARPGLHPSLRETSRPAGVAAFLPVRLRVVGVDRPRIVAAATQVLAGRGIHVASLESRLQDAPESVTPLFVLTAELQVPSEVALSSLRLDIAAVCDEEN